MFPKLLIQLVSFFLAATGSLAAADAECRPAEKQLNKTLANYRLPGRNGHSSYLTHDFIPTTCGSRLSVHYTEPTVYGNLTGSAKKPVLILLHGWPQSSYAWRHVTQALSERVPVIAFDTPGYGLSSPCASGADQLTTGTAILEAVTKIYGKNTSIILAGHDRGARIVQRLAVNIDHFPHVRAMGVFIVDILPVYEKFRSFSKPQNAIGYYHWSFLPRGAFALDMIKAYGGGNFIKGSLQGGSGPNEKGLKLFKSDNAWEVYANFFDQVSIANYSISDFRSSATVEYETQEADQKAGRKIKMPCFVFYSEHMQTRSGLSSSGFSMAEIWPNWVATGVKLILEGVGRGIGHFIVEEAPEDTIQAMDSFMDDLEVDKAEA
ncbi:putative Fluoroacetate dehalogenase [Ophiocordyceps camponoti-floridani]|uniref:Putative Fluoroacetate dehalogenase n=1 Tax=Ophiocordyceps camponoti-floridani TaxID=2030778 RepID=A0A8H4Q763_9HYPO|nr:putative Fluoroacetate dehalogenase [Ophiocordyceps camponoti-floridani]